MCAYLQVGLVVHVMQIGTIKGLVEFIPVLGLIFITNIPSP